MREKRLRWFGHVRRSEEQGLCKRVMEVKVGKRSRGRPKKRFKDCIEEDLKIKGMEVNDAEGERFTPVTLINQEKQVEEEECNWPIDFLHKSFIFFV